LRGEIKKLISPLFVVLNKGVEKEMALGLAELLKTVVAEEF
jgi:hypothetical protein